MEVARLPDEGLGVDEGKDEEEGLLSSHLRKIGKLDDPGYLKRGVVRDLGLHKDDFLRAAEAFRPVQEYPGEVLLREKEVLQRYEGAGGVHTWEIMRSPDTVLRKADLTFSLLLQFLVLLSPWLLLGFGAYYWANKYKLAGSLSDLEEMHRILGIIVSISIGFQNKTSYDRFWEGRKLVSTLYNLNREVVLEAYSALPKAGGDEAARRDRMFGMAREIRRRVNIFCAFGRQAVRESVRGFMPGSTVRHLPYNKETFVLDPVLPRLRDLLTEKELARYSSIAPSRRPAVVAGELKAIIQLMGEDVMGVSEYRRFSHQHVKGMMEALEAMIRIRDTPIAAPYDWIKLISSFALVYSTPFIFQNLNTGELWKFPALGVLVVTELLALTFFGMTIIDKELQNPYGYGLPDLALEEMCLVLHKDTLMVATSLGDDTTRYIPDAAWSEVPFKRGYIERGLECALFVLSPLLRRVRRRTKGGAHEAAPSVTGDRKSVV